MKHVDAIVAADAPLSTRPSIYPPPFAARMDGRSKRRLGEVFGLVNFGVNLATLAPGGSSSLRHAHARQDEFIYVLSGHPTLHTNSGKQVLSPGMCAGFRASDGNAHRLLNETDSEVSYLEIGDRTAGDLAIYPDDDLQAVAVNGTWQFLHKDGRPY